MQWNKKVVPEFLYGENIHSDREIFPPLKFRHFSSHNISKNTHMKYNIMDSKNSVSSSHRLNHSFMRQIGSTKNRKFNKSKNKSIQYRRC